MNPVEEPIEDRVAEHDDRQRGRGRGEKQSRELRLRGREHRQLPADEIAHGERDHEYRDDATPDVNAIAEVRRQDAAAQKLDRHHVIAAPPSHQVDDEPLHRGHGIRQRVKERRALKHARPAFVIDA